MLPPVQRYNPIQPVTPFLAKSFRFIISRLKLIAGREGEVEEHPDPGNGVQSLHKNMVHDIWGPWSNISRWSLFKRGLDQSHSCYIIHSK